jgi:hypothetical protein
MNREILVSAVLRAESRREGAIDIDIVRRALAAQPAPVPVPLTEERKKLDRLRSKVREVFQAGRDSYDTPAAAYSTNEEAWEKYCAAHGIAASPEKP